MVAAKVWDGSTWQFIGAAPVAQVQSGAPTGPAVGQFWLDTDELAQGSGGAYVCTSATRPSSPTIGQQIFETDTGKLQIWTGAAWLLVAENTGFTYPSLGNAWVQAGGWGTVGYCRVNGIVYLKGTMISGTVGQAAFFLPAGYRPVGNRMFPDITNSSYGRTQVRASDGAVYIDSGGSNAGWSLDGINFVAEA